MQPSRSAADNEVRSPLIPRARMQSGRPSVRQLPVALVPVAQAAVPTLSEQITTRIRAEIAAFAGERRRLHRRIHDAVVVAVDAFVRLASGEQTAYARVDHHFHSLGQAEARTGASVEPVTAAIRLADRSVWQTIRAVAVDHGVEGPVVADLGADVSAYLKHLEAQVQLGFTTVAAGAPDATGLLVKTLLQPNPGAGDKLAGLAGLAEDAGWQLSEQVAVVTAQRRGASPGGRPVPGRALARVAGDHTIVVTAPGDVAAAREALLRLGPGVVVAESWPVELQRVRDAYSWTRRALALVNNGQLRPEHRVVDCAHHRTTLLLAADPPLVESLASELLQPLLAEKPHQRLVLAETLVLRLETDESAAALSRRLGTCPQTVRNRVQRLGRMFEGQLDDPSQRMALMLVLNAVLPRWRAEQPPRRQRSRRKSASD